MACCIFVAFLATQILALLELIGLRSGSLSRERRMAEQNWRLGDVPEPFPASQQHRYGDNGRPLPRWATVSVFGLELTIVAAVGVWLFVLDGAPAIAADVAYLSEVRSLSDFLALCGL